MRRTNKIKTYLARVLAAAMVITMAVPPVPVYALNYGETAVLRFDLMDGPDLSHSNYATVPINNRITYATGQAGYPLTQSADFNGIATQNLGSGGRPILPVFDSSLTWPGYTFDGWYNADGNKMAYLPYAFPYSASTTYEARWNGDSTSQFDFTVMHYRDLNGSRDANPDGTDPAAWPATGDSQIYEFFNNGSWVTPVTANTAVSATYKRDIPGYKVASVLIKNNKLRRFDDLSGQGTLGEAATINASTRSVRGNMPNDDLTVAYRYEPDSSKKFALQVEYVDTNNLPIRVPESSLHSAETPVSASPATITAYVLTGAHIKAGSGDVDDLAVSGIYSAQTAGGQFDAQKNFTGKMPNQPVTLVYTYDIDPAYVTSVTINRIDNHNNVLDNQEIQAVSPGGTVAVNVERKAGYIYPPNIDWNGNFTNVSLDQSTETLSFTTDITGGNVTITYNEDLNDSTQWGRINYYNSAHGTLSGDISPRSFRLGSHTIDELTAGIIPSPEQNYVFNGWFKANASGTGKTGEALTGNIDLTGDLKLYGDFVEDPGQWCDISFESGSHGSISGTSFLHVVKGTLWSQLILPQTTADNNYMFAGWFDENGNQVTDSSMQILADQTYRARFTPVGGDDGILCIPDGAGSIGTDGMGQIEINGANEARKYALTDSEGRVLAVMTGAQLGSGHFGGLAPCESYYVYEMAESAAPVAGDILTDTVDPTLISQPARVTVPALGNNYSIADDTTEGLKKILIRPAAENTVYAILDADGNVVSQEGSADGWVSPSGSPLTAELTGLEPNASYTVVAKQVGGSDDPSDCLLNGSQVMVLGTSQQGQLYTFRMMNGGYVESVTRNGAPVAIDDAEEVLVMAGDQIRISAENTNSYGQPFKQWEILIGSVSIPFLDRKNQTVEMTAGDVILLAVYDPSPTATASNATVDYTPKNGVFALDKSDAALQELKEELVDNSEDSAALASGKKVAYTVKFDRHTPLASASNALRQALDDDESVMIPWSLDIGLARKVDGTSKPLASGGNLTPEITVYAKLDNSLLGNLEYRLWKVEFGPTEGDVTCMEIPMVPDPNGNDDFTGSFSFAANIGDTLVLTYCKAYEVTIVDASMAQVHTFKVKAKHSLDDTDDYLDLDIHAGYTDPITGIDYEFIGLSKRQDAVSMYDTSDPVTRNLTLYVVYEPEDDTLWQEAKEKLRNEINIANALKENGSVSQEDRDALTDAVAEAVDILNRLPRPSISELENAYDTLKALVDSIRNGGGAPGDPSNPGDPGNPGNPVNPKPGNGSSGGGGGGGGLRVSGVGVNVENSYHTYLAGTDGNWDNFDPANHKWAFVLNSGNRIENSWANVRNLGSTQAATFHFDSEGVMDSGWFLDSSTGKWYFLSTAHDGWYGRMLKEWHHDETDGNWYYLNQFTGAMMMGWQKIEGKWYYLTPANQEQTWSFSEVSKRWEYTNRNGRPLGAMYINRLTPDGHLVDENGSWIQETP